MNIESWVAVKCFLKREKGYCDFLNNIFIKMFSEYLLKELRFFFIEVIVLESR